MKCTAILAAVAAAVAMLVPPAGATAQEPAAEPLRREAVLRESVEAEVVAIDYESREVTLRGPAGAMVTVTAAPRVQRLNQIEVGDTVVLDYYVSVVAELREPTAEEIQEPASVKEHAYRTAEDLAPGGAVGTTVRAVVTVSAIDPEAEIVTVETPGGEFVQVRSASPENLEKIEVGDKVVVTYTESVAVSLEKRE